MPLIAALSLVAGRRGNGLFCLAGARWLLNLGNILAATGAIWIAASYLAQVTPYNAGIAQMLAPLFLPAGMPWLSSLAAWLAGWLSSFIAFMTVLPLAQEKYRLKYLRLPLLFSLLATFLYFASSMLGAWPFAGLPEGLTWERAFMAIFRHSSRAYFLGLCPAGAVALALWPFWQKNLDDFHKAIATRWLSFWAVAGAVPGIFASWGLALGAKIGSASLGAQAPGLQTQIYALSIFSFAIACWAYLLWRPRYLTILAWVALALFLLKTLLPGLLAG